jgi:undecaprenyl-diphosphatase
LPASTARAGLLKVPDLLGPLGAGIRDQVVVGALAAAASSLFAVIFLSRYLKTRTLLSFASRSSES